MKYTNPIIPGMYPDPSVCYADGTYYLVNSTFEYFPGVPVFESKDLINWRQIGNCLTRESQLDLEGCSCSGGVFAPTIRYHEGEFYMITTCMGKNGLKNFYVKTKDPSSEWSDPVFIEIEGIDSSLFWENGKTYVQYAGFSEIFQVEIEAETGKILKGPLKITNGCGGRDAEGPHMWKRNGYYYLLLAEGGTREGHMVTMMRGKNIWGPFEPSPYNPVISNKDLGRQPIECVGHADWIVDENGNDYLVTLGTRPIKHKTLLGRETMLSPAYWTEDGWLRSKYGYMPIECEVNINSEQIKENSFSLDMNSKVMPLNIISPRKSNKNYYKFENGILKIKGNGYILEDGRAALWALRQTEFNFQLLSEIEFYPKNINEEAGITMLVSNDYYMSLFISVREGEKAIVLRKKVADIVTEKFIRFPNKNESILLKVKGTREKYEFYYDIGNEEFIDWTDVKHLTVECASTPNTGVVGGVYVIGNSEAVIKQFSYRV